MTTLRPLLIKTVELKTGYKPKIRKEYFYEI